MRGPIFSPTNRKGQTDMGYGAALAVVGLLTGAGGAFLEGKAGDIARKRLQKAARLPGLNTGALTEEALRDQLKYMPLSKDLAGQISSGNQANLLAQEEQALPGAGAARGEALGRILSLFSDDAKWLEGVQRRAGALGVRSGMFGSQAGQIGSLRLADTESQARMSLGSGLLSQLLSTLRIANSPGIQEFLGPTPNQLIGVRSQERAAKQQLLAQAAGIPGQTAAWGDWMQSTGGALMGAGMGMMGGGSPSGGGGGSWGNLSGAQQNAVRTGIGALGASSFGCWIAREVFGDDDPDWLRFWTWKQTKAPAWFRVAYELYGESIAHWLRANPNQRPAVRAWMKEQIANG